MPLNDHQVNSDHWYYDSDQLKSKIILWNLSIFITYSIDRLVKVLDENILHNRYSSVEYDYRYLALDRYSLVPYYLDLIPSFDQLKYLINHFEEEEDFYLNELNSSMVHRIYIHIKIKEKFHANNEED